MFAPTQLFKITDRNYNQSFPRILIVLRDPSAPPPKKKIYEYCCRCIIIVVFSQKAKEGVRWFSGSAFDCRSRGPCFESFPGLTWISLETINKSPMLHSTKVGIGTPRGQCLCSFDIPGRRILAVHKTGSEMSEIVSPGRPEHLFPNVAQWPGKDDVKGWLNDWIAESDPTKTGNFILVV